MSYEVNEICFDKIYYLIFGPDEFIKTTSTTLRLIPYFSTMLGIDLQEIYSTNANKTLFDRVSDRLKSIIGIKNGCENRIFIDKDKESVNHILEVIRSCNMYQPPDWIEYDWNYFFNNNGKIYDDKDIIKICVSGEYFWTTRETLMATEGILKIRLERWSIGEEIFLDRNPGGFRHILSLLRNPNYQFPENLAYELDFYGISRIFKKKKADTMNQRFKFKRHLFDLNDSFNNNSSGQLTGLVAYDGHDSDITINHIPEVNANQFGQSNQFGYAEQVRNTRHHRHNGHTEHDGDIEHDGYNRHIGDVREVEHTWDIHNHSIYQPKQYKQLRSQTKFHTLKPNDNSRNRWGGEIDIPISRACDSFHKMYLQIHINNSDELDFRYPDKIIFSLIKNISFYSSRTSIDRFNQDLLYLWMKIYHEKDYQLFIEKLGKQYLVLPLYFFFCDQIDLVLHRVSEVFTDSGINIQLAHFNEVIRNYDNVDENNHQIDIKLITNAILLDTFERRHVVQILPKHTFLRHCLYHEHYIQSKNTEINLNSDGIIKQILIVIQPDSKIDENNLSDDGNENEDEDDVNILDGKVLEVNDNDNNDYDVNNMDDEEYGKLFYYGKKDLLDHGELFLNGHLHTQINPLQSVLDRHVNGISDLDIPIYIITFGHLDVNNLHIPTGGNINFNKIDSIKLNLNLKISSGVVKIWLFSYATYYVQTGWAQIRL